MQYQNLRNHRWVRRAVGALAGWVVVCLVAWLAVPSLLKAQLQQRASEQLGRAVTVGRVEFRPWTLELTVHDLRVAQAAGDAPQLEVKRLYMNAELQSLLRLAPVVDAIEVDAPRVWLRHLGGGYIGLEMAESLTLRGLAVTGLYSALVLGLDARARRLVQETVRARLRRG